MAAGNPALAQMMARQLIAKIGGQGGPPAGPGGPMPPPPGMTGQAGPGAAGAGPAGMPPGGPGAGGPGGPGSPPTPPAGMQLSQQLAELQGADPDAIIKSLTQMKSMAVQHYTRAAFTMPGVTRNLAQVVKFLDNSIQEAEKAAATTAAAGPIANNAAIQNPSAAQSSQPGPQ